MLLPKESRALIHEANGRPVQIPWPEDIEPPKRGHVYTIQSRARTAGHASILVIDWREFGPEEDGDGLLVRVQQQSDPARTRISKSRRRHDAGTLATILTIDPKAKRSSDLTETEPERIDAEAEELLALQANARTAILKADHRCHAKVGRHEREIAEAKATGQPTALAEGRLDRARVRLKEARAHAMPLEHRAAAERHGVDSVVQEVVGILDEARGFRL